MVVSLSTTIVALIICISLTIIISYNHIHREIEAEIILTSLALILLLLIWKEVLPTQIILLPILIMGLNAYIITRRI